MQSFGNFVAIAERMKLTNNALKPIYVALKVSDGVRWRRSRFAIVVARKLSQEHLAFTDTVGGVRIFISDVARVRE